MNTIFSTPKINSLGLYVAPEVQFGSALGTNTAIGGMSVMLVTNEKWAFGGTFNRVGSPNFAPSVAQGFDIESGYGGLKIEYTPNPKSAYHFSFPLTIGGGMVSIDSNDNNYEYMGRDSMYKRFDDHIGTQRYFVIQPGFQFEMNLMKYSKFYLGANYRFAADINPKGGKAFDNAVPSTFDLKNGLNGWGVYAGLKIGLFDYKLK
jgi:hypothetical protein